MKTPKELRQLADRVATKRAKDAEEAAQKLAKEEKAKEEVRLARGKVYYVKLLEEEIEKAAADGKCKCAVCIEDEPFALRAVLSKKFAEFKPVWTSVEKQEIINYDTGTFKPYRVPCINLSW